MNIFVLDEDPFRAAEYACDKHVVKMILETAQLLCSAYQDEYSCDSCGPVPYKKTHYNHPCSKWARESMQNYEWLIMHGDGLCAEYTSRYGKHHKSGEVIRYCEKHMPDLPDLGLTSFAQAMPDQYKSKSAVAAYRDYYKGEKSRIAKWKNGAPDWYGGD